MAQKASCMKPKDNRHWPVWLGGGGDSVTMRGDSRVSLEERN